jgi:hypothetical protein
LPGAFPSIDGCSSPYRWRLYAKGGLRRRVALGLCC